MIDKNGIIRYIDIHDIGQQPDNEDVYKILREIDPIAATAENKEAKFVTAPSLPKGGIIMYCTSWCPACRRARSWFKGNNLDYIEIDIDTNPAAADQVKKWNKGNRTTPTFDIDGVIITNFDENKLRSVLKDRINH